MKAAQFVILVGSLVLAGGTAWSQAPISPATVKDAPFTSCDQYAASPLEAGFQSGIPEHKIDPDLAIPACQEAVRQFPQSSRLLFQLGLAYKKHDLTVALQHLRDAATTGYAPAQAAIGLMYEAGQGTSRNELEAVSWYRKAAGQNYPLGQVYLGSAYLYGHGVPQDSTQAAVWFRLAADQDFSLGQYLLCALYATGKGVPRDFSLAAELCRKAADQGLGIAQFMLGRFYAAGTGVAQDIGEARAWYERAVDRGYQPAKDALAQLGPASSAPPVPKPEPPTPTQAPTLSRTESAPSPPPEPPVRGPASTRPLTLREQQIASTERAERFAYCGSLFDTRGRAGERLELSGHIPQAEAQKFLQALEAAVSVSEDLRRKSGSPDPGSESAFLRGRERGRNDAERLSTSEVIAWYEKCRPLVAERLAPPPPRRPEAEQPPRPVQAITSPARPAPSLAAVVSAREVESVRKNLQRCWDPGITRGQGFTSTFIIEMRPDGTPSTAELSQASRQDSDPTYRAAVDAARAAILNPRCHPWPLPPEKYQSWKRITLNFDSRDY